ncbi:MAG: arginine--tRNA ligase [bacterium]|nr:arginine--tRNA ligase [bacterium]
MDISLSLKQGISKAFQELFSHELAVEEIALQPTRKDFEGSHTFVTFPYGRISKKSPEETGKSIGEFLVANVDAVAAYNVVKGFLNLELSDSLWLQVLSAVNANDKYGVQPSNGEKVMVEYSSPNTNKPLHLGHLRNNFLGYSVAQILDACGYDVLKVNLVNDRGIHICKSMLAYQKFGEGETPESAGMKGDHLIGKYYVKFDQEYKKEIEGLVANGSSEEDAKKQAPLILEAQQMLKNWETGDEDTVALWEKMNNWVYEGFDQTYNTMGVSFDKMYKESNTYLLGKDLVDEGLEKGIFFKKDDNSVWANLTEEGLDEKLVLRGDGTSVYITQDMGTCELKYADFPFDKSVYVVGNEQDYHFDVLFKIMKKLGRSYGEGLYHLSYGMVDLPSGKMKSREGTVVDADDLMQDMFDTAEKHTQEKSENLGFSEEEAKELYRIIGLGAIKYFLLKVDPRKRMLFDPEESIELTGNTGPFIQYSHARISAISRRAKELGVNTAIDQNLSLEDAEKRLIVELSNFPQKVLQAGADYSPSIVAQYVYDLAKEYNRFYGELKIFDDDNKDKWGFRVALSENVGKVLKTGMKLLGIDVPERM